MTTPREVHLVGSVPLASAADVFRATSAILGARLNRYPDGETGKRKNWINFQFGVIARHPAFEHTGAPIDPDELALEGGGRGADYQVSPMRLRPGASTGDLRFPALGYAEAALASYALFAELKRSGAIHAGARFQVALPTPLAPVAIFVVPENLFAVYPRYLEALFGELDQILAAVPHGELAVQWDVAVEMGLWEGLFPPPPGDWKGMLLGQLADLGNRIPAGVQLGYHFCYGDRGHKHFVEPKDTANLVEVANGVAAGVRRPIEWMHLPVPRDRDDHAYFAPLAGLRLHPETKLFLGLVHMTGGIEGSRRRIAAAERVVPDFGLATECGMGRRDPGTIPELLRLHAALP
jgi:hypothetical protein